MLRFIHVCIKLCHQPHWESFESKLNTSKWAKMNKTSTATTLRDIQDLVEKGTLRCADECGRSTNNELMDDKNSKKD